MKTLLMIFCLLVSLARADEKKFTMADLEALAKSESWQELSQHLGDIPPTQRDAKWEAIVEKAAVGILEQESDAGRKQELAASWIKQYPSLKKSKVVSDAKKTVDLASYEKCFQQSYAGSECTDSLMKAVKENKENADFALKAAQLVVRSMNAQVAAPFFKMAVTGANKATACKDDGLQRAVVAGLGVPDGPMKDSAKELASKLCWPEMKEKMVETLSGQTEGYYADAACPILVEKKALKGLMEKKCRKKSG